MGERHVTDIEAGDDGWVDIGDEFDVAEHDGTEHEGTQSAADGGAGFGTRGAAGARRGRPSQRRQVHPGQPHPRRPPGGRAGRAWRDPGPGRLRRQLARQAVHPGGHRRLGARAQGLAAQVAEQAEIAVGLADAVLFVVDARVGATDEDEAVARVLRRAGKPVVLVANKVDDAKSEADAQSLWSLGLGEPVMVSAMHGRGSGDMLDLCLEALPEAPPERLGRGRPAPRRADRPAQRRQVVPAQQAGRRAAGGGRLGRGHDA